MFSPTGLLMLLVTALGLFGSGVSIGVKWERRDALANLHAAEIKAINDANTAVDLAIQRTLAEAKKEATARAKAREIRYRGELDAAKKSRPECARDGGSFGLLNDAIRAANSEASPSSELPDGVRTSAKPSGWIGTLTEKLGVSGGGAVRPVPEAAPTMREGD